MSACASGQAELSVFLSLLSSSPAGWFVSHLLDAVFIEWYSHFICIGISSRLSDTSGVSVSLSVSGPVGLCLGFPFRFLWFCLLSVSLVGGLSSSSCCLYRVAACVCCCSYIGLFATIGLRVKLYLFIPFAQSGLVGISSVFR